jgi:ABC-2 type transport system permease protein
MNKIIQIAIKDARLQFSSAAQWLFFLILPIVFTFLLAGADFGTGDATGLRLLVIDADGGDVAAELRDRLSNNATLAPDLLPASEALQLFDDNAAAALLRIPQRFSAAVAAGEAVTLDLRVQPNNTNAVAIQQAIQTEVTALSLTREVAAVAVQEAERIKPFASQAARDAFFADTVTQAQQQLADAPAQVTRTVATTTDDAFQIASHQAIGQLLTWVFIPLLGTSVLFASERTGGTLRRLLTLPVRKTTYLFGTIFGSLGLGLIQMTILVLFGRFALGISYGRDPLGLALLLVAFALAATALGTTLGTLVKTESQANNLSIMLGMVMALLGGCWFPIEIFPPAARLVAMLFPTRWAMAGMTDLAVRGQAVGDVLPEVGVLLLFALLFFAIGTRRFRYE